MTYYCLIRIDQVFHWLKINKNQYANEYWCIHFLEYDWDAAIPRWNYHRGKFPLLYSSHKNNLTFLPFFNLRTLFTGENVPIFRYMGEENGVLIWIKRSQVINFNPPIRSQCTLLLPPENIRKKRKGALGMNGLMSIFYCHTQSMLKIGWNQLKEMWKTIYYYCFAFPKYCHRILHLQDYLRLLWVSTSSVCWLLK